MVCVGIVTGARGLKGEVRIASFTADPSSLAGYGPVWDETGERPYRLTVTGRIKGQVVAAVEGIVDRSGAEALQGRRLYLPREALPEPDEDEFYHVDLIGLRAEIAEDAAGGGRFLGWVRAVYDFGAGSMVEIADGPVGVVMVPFSKAAVPRVDIPGGRIAVTPLPGLFAPEPDGEAEAGDEEANGSGV